MTLVRGDIDGGDGNAALSRSFRGLPQWRGVRPLVSVNVKVIFVTAC